MINKKTLNTLIRVFFWGTIITGALLLAAYAHGSASSKKSNTTCWLPEGCVTQYQDNPYTYKVGKVQGVGTPDTAIVLRVQPLATYSLFTEDILFCDREKVMRMFVGKRNPFILTYKTQASRLIQGIGCHDLVRVDEMRDTLP